MEFTHDGKQSLFGTYDDKTAWRMTSIGQGLALFGFEDIGGSPVPIPPNVSMRCLEPTLIDPFAHTEAPTLKEQYLLREGASYELVAISTEMRRMNSLLTITKKQYHEVSPHDARISKVRAVRLERG